VVTTEERPDILNSADLLARSRGGEAEAFCELAQAGEARLFRQAVALCHNPTTAEDLVVETLAEAWKSLHRFNQTCRFSTWLYAILLHRWQKLARKSRSRPVPLASLPSAESGERESLLERSPDSQPLPAEALLQKETAARLSQAIETLPPKFQQVVRLRFYEEASLPEIAAALDLPLGTVKSRLYYALDNLRRMKSLVNLFNESEDT
jgi:RNA polymerase sigma-70 factor (ECF subfamily)